MEKLPSIERKSDGFTVEPPVCEAYLDQNSDVFSGLFDDETERCELRRQIDERLIQSRNVLKVLRQLSDSGELPTIENDEMVDFYESLSEIIKNPEYRRLILYLPFQILPNEIANFDNYELARASFDFRNTYFDAWCSLLDTQDVRANFVDGDVFEVEARPNDPNRVVKAAHMIPWMMKANIIKVSDVQKLIQIDDKVLARSIGDTVPALHSFGLLNDEEYDFLKKHSDRIGLQEIQEPIFISEGRKLWLDSRVELGNKVLVEGQNLTGDFSKNIDLLGCEINDIKDKLSKLDTDSIKRVALIGGSRVKGYGCRDSDTDVYLFVDSGIKIDDWLTARDLFSEYKPTPIYLDKYNNLINNNEKWAHVILNNLWVGDLSTINDLRNILVRNYITEEKTETRKRSVECMENDLLLYRLLHTGYSRHYKCDNFNFSDQNLMGENSPFYSDGYRKIATELYIKRIFIPSLNPKK